jgi:tetratricopeptide (TPR) repeat protein
MLCAVETQQPQGSSRLAEAFPLIAAAVLGLAGVVLFLAVLWPEGKTPSPRDVTPAPATTPVPAAPQPAQEATTPAPAAPHAPADMATPAPVVPQASEDTTQAKAPPAETRQSEAPAAEPSVAPTPGAQAMVDAALQGDDARVQQLARELSSTRPKRGDRPRARKLNAQGLALMNTARYAEAVSAFEAAYKVDDADVEVRENLGYALLKAGRIEEAERALLAALEIGPRRASAWGSLGFVYAKQGRDRDAVQIILTAHRFAGNRRKALESYARQANTDADPKVRAMLGDAVNRLRQVR